MDLARLTDKNYLAELAAETAQREANPAYLAERTAYLDSLLPVISKQLADTASWQMPNDVSVDESVSICLALNIKEAVAHPVPQFLMVRPWLQAWILRKWRMERFIGRTIGISI